MGPESLVIPSLSCVIERCSNHSCQKGSRWPLIRMIYLITLTLRSDDLFSLQEAYRIAVRKRGAKSTLSSTIFARYREGARRATGSQKLLSTLASSVIEVLSRL